MYCLELIQLSTACLLSLRTDLTFVLQVNLTVLRNVLW